MNELVQEVRETLDDATIMQSDLPLDSLKNRLTTILEVAEDDTATRDLVKHMAWHIIARDYTVDYPSRNPGAI